MPRFRPGESGNPSGRPRSATGLRELLIAKYGGDAKTLVDRLEKLSTGRNPRLAMQATQLLLEYHAGKPLNAVMLDVDVTARADRWTTDELLARLPTEELEALRRINARLWPAERLLGPERKDNSDFEADQAT